MNFGTYTSRMPMVVKNLLIINVIMMIATWITGNFMYQYFSLFYFESPFFRPYQVISYMFMHGGFMHIFFNMWALVMFGSLLENMWGSKKFFIYYMVCGIGAGLVNELVMYLQIVLDPTIARSLMGVPTVGASGAIYGLLLAYGMLFPNSVMTLIFPPISLKAKWFVIIFGAIELVSGIFSGVSGTNVAHFAHLGGMLFGLILILIWKKKNKLYS